MIEPNRLREFFDRILYGTNGRVSDCGDRYPIELQHLADFGVSVDDASDGLRRVASLQAIPNGVIGDRGRWVELPALCRSCRFFSGDRHLLCAVRPQGYEGDRCPDWEGK